MLSPAAAVEQAARQTQLDAVARLRQLRKWLSGLPKWLVIATLFALCVAPTFISYQGYLFRWDDSDYLYRSIVVSQAFWSWDLHRLRYTMVGIKPPAMTLLGLPWGPLVSWDAAGRCLMTLAAVVSLLASSCLYMLLRIGVKPFFLILASVCVGVSMGPYPHSGETHYIATGFYADTLLAWTALAAILLVPYEARTPCPQLGDAALRGIVWGSIFSLGMLTKLSFLYFVVFIIPVLFLIRLHYGRFRTAFAAVTAFALSSAPTTLYFLLFGQPALDHAKASSFGWYTQYFYNPLLEYLSDTIRDSPGLTLSLVLMAVALIYLVIKRRLMQSWPDFLALLIMIGFATIAIASNNRVLGAEHQVRSVFPAIVALPFLVAILMSGKGGPAPRLSAALASGLVFCGLLAASVPTLFRASSQSLDRVNAVLAHAAQCYAGHIMLATDSPTLNIALLALAIEISRSSDTVKAGTLAHNAFLPIDEDFRTIRESDQVVFQDKDALNPWWANLRVSEYEQYVRQNGYVPTKVASDVTVYSIRCRA